MTDKAKSATPKLDEYMERRVNHDLVVGEMLNHTQLANMKYSEALAFLIQHLEEITRISLESHKGRDTTDEEDEFLRPFWDAVGKCGRLLAKVRIAFGQLYEQALECFPAAMPKKEDQPRPLYDAWDDWLNNKFQGTKEFAITCERYATAHEGADDYKISVLVPMMHWSPQLAEQTTGMCQPSIYDFLWLEFEEMVYAKDYIEETLGDGIWSEYYPGTRTPRIWEQKKAAGKKRYVGAL